MVLTGSSSPTPVLAVYGINKKSGSLGLKNQFSSRFSRSDLPVRSGSENSAYDFSKLQCARAIIKSLFPIVIDTVMTSSSTFNSS